MSIYVVFGMMDDIEIACEACSTLERAIQVVTDSQADLAAENQVSDKKVNEMCDDTHRAFKNATDKGRYGFSEHEDDMGITWRIKRCQLR